MDHILWKGDKPTKYQFLQEKQEGGTVLRMAYALRGRIYPTILVILENGVICLHIIGTIRWMISYV